MKRIIIILGLLFCSLQVLFSQQQKRIWLENFNGNLPPSGWQVLPNTDSWQATSMYFIQDSSTANPQSYRGEVPHRIGDTTILVTPVYNCDTFSHVSLRFSHICKISPNDQARIEYRTHTGGGQMSAWKSIEKADYMGRGTYSEETGFNAASYSEWDAANMATLPRNTWWKEELFDMTNVANFTLVQFRFVIKHGDVAGTQLSYGWLLENVELMAATHQVAPPTVQLMSPFIKDTVYSAGPWIINAKAKTNTNARMEIPWLKWTTNTGFTDSVPMSKVGTGDSLWRGSIGQYIAGTTVTYLVEGKDSVGNTTTVYSKYTIKLVCGSGAGGGDFPYTGSEQTAILSPGIYKIECWGADGGDATQGTGGKGGYSMGTISVTTTTMYYVYVGGRGITVPTNGTGSGGWNGGGSITGTTGTGGGGTGGGGTDIRTSQNTTYANRIIVAGGGGGAAGYSTYTGVGGAGGGTIGADGTSSRGVGYFGYGGTQTAGGLGAASMSGYSTAGGFGTGGDYTGTLGGSAGGGGWYGGGGSHWGGAGGGGSGYIGGVTNGVTAQYSQMDFVANPVSDGNGFVRITAISGGDNADCPDYSAAMYSIDLNDTIPTSPTAQLPVVVTIKNTGLQPLDSATVSYMLNGSHIKDTVVSFVPALPWDFNGQATIGYFTPQAANFDSLTVWVKLPNGYIDTVTFDDTLGKKTYGIVDISAEFVTVPKNVVITTGPHEVTARIKSLTGTPPVSVYLYVTDTSETAGRNYDTLTMQLQGGDIWSVDIPNIAFESDVQYTLVITDFLGNNIKLSGSYYIQYVCPSAGGIGGDYTYTGTVQEVQLAPGTYQIECWGADGGTAVHSGYTMLGGKGGYSKGRVVLTSQTPLYIVVGGKGQDFLLNQEGPGGFNGGGDATVGNNAGNGSGGGATHIATRDGLLSTLETFKSDVKIVAGGAGGGHVYATSGSYLFSGGNGGGINGQDGLTGTSTGMGGSQTAGGAGGGDASPGIFGRGGDGRVQTATGGSGGGGGWYGGGGGSYQGGAGGGSGYIGGVDSGMTVQFSAPEFVLNPDTSGNGYVRITLISGGEVVCLDNSVAIDEILSPEERGTIGTLTPVTVRIRNKGVLDLDSCYINWTLNGELQSSAVVYKNANGLPEDFTDTVTIGYYTVAIDGGTDSIIAWVSLPNGEVDSIAWDDTLKVSSFACPQSMSLVRVGTGGDYPTINEVIKVLRNCGVSQDITLELKGVFTENIDLSNFSDLMNGYHLSITSADKHSDSAIIRPSSGVAFLLDNSNNITIENITIDVRATTSAGIQFTGDAANITINNCIILASPTATATPSAPIYKATSTGSLDGLIVKNCVLDGGYDGIRLYGTTSNYCQNITIDSNIISNSYYYGAYLYYLNQNSVSYNRVTPRASIQGTTWYGLYFNYARNGGDIVGNRIYADNSGISSTLYGLYTNNIDSALVVNNEIYLNSSASTTYGMYMYNHKAVDYFHNTVLLTGTGGSTFRAAHYYVSTSTSYNATVKNNIFVADGGTTPYAIYLSAAPGATFAQYNDIDYNNYYSSGDLGYAGAAQADLSAWKSVVPTDSNSINIVPLFTDTDSNLKVSNYAEMLCDYISPVNTDIDDNPRNAITTMGCYEGIPSATANIMLTKLLGFREGLTLGQTDSLKVVVLNAGTTPVSSVNLSWSVNGVSQIVGGHNFTLSSTLAQWESDTITFGEIIYTFGLMDVKVWLNNINGGLADEVKDDDTLTVSGTICDTILSDTVIISASGNGDYLNMREAFDKGVFCGVGNVILVLDTGTYTENINLTDFANLFGNHSLTFTSITGNPADVTIKPASGVGFLLNNSNNITIENITIDVRATTSAGIQFTGDAANITINNCIILASPTATATPSAPIYKATSTGSLDGLIVKNCVLDGGYDGIRLYGTSSNYCQNITIDSNIISNQYYYGAYLYYVNQNSMSYNKVTPRSFSQGTTWYGVYAYYINGGGFLSNRIHANNSGITSTLKGIQLYYADSSFLVANNEIYLNSSAGTTDGIYMDYPRKVFLLHNTIYTVKSGTTGTNRAHYNFINNANERLTVKNNIFIAEGGAVGTTYAFYIGGTLVNQTSGGLITNYNDYYSSGTNLGYVGAGARTNLSAWQSILTTDSNSVSNLPVFKNLPNSLDLMNYDSLYCDTIPGITADITGSPRRMPTVMGCYEEVILNVNVLLAEIIGLREGLVNGESDTVKVVVYNTGATALNSINLGWSINDTIQTPAAYSFNSPLTRGQSDTITVGVITYSPGYHTLKVFVNDLDQGALLDENFSDDTLSMPFYICDGPFSGNIAIGNTGRFSTVTEALSIMPICGVGGDITFVLDSGTYIENINLANINNLIGNYSLTVTSSTGNAADVIIRPEAGVAFLLNNSNNIILDNITIDATQGISGIQFTSACTNIVIRNCKILASQTATAVAYSGIYKASATGLLDNVQIIGNEFEGGSAGIYLYAGTGSTAFGTNIVVDSNIVTNTAFSGIFLYYANLNSVSYNQVTVEPIKSCSTTYHGIYMNYARNGRNIIGNRILIDNPTITTTLNGLYTYYVDTALVANNEIILNTKATTTSGIYIDYPREVNYFHNSVLVTGTGATQRALYWYTYANTTYSATINNNIFVANGSGATAYALHLTANVRAYQNNYRLDYNNYYSSGTNLGYVGTAQADLAAWKLIMTADINSVNSLPAFVSSTILEPVDYAGLLCERSPLVVTDIRENTRGTRTTTTMGCYEGNLVLDKNASLVEISGITPNVIRGDKDTLSVVFSNMGLAAIDSVNIAWSVNNTLYGSQTVYYTSPLLTDQSDTILLGEVLYATGATNIKIWINQANDWTTDDGFVNDDTLRTSFYVCDVTMSGNIVVSDTSFFKTIKQFVEVLPNCPLVGDVVLLLDSGVYAENVVFTNISNYMNAYSLTITSITGNPADVTIKPTSGVAFLLNNSSNITIENITIDVRTGSYGVQFTGVASNITINNCIILADPKATATGKVPIYKATSTGALDGITIKNCTLDGGYEGIRLYGTTSAYCQNVTIDSNIISNSYYYGAYLYYVNQNSVSYNKVMARDSNQATTWYGLYFYYARNGGDIVGNRIYADNSGISSSLYGLYTYYMDSALVANNEIHLNSAASTTYGMYMYNHKAVDYFHNTVLLTGRGGSTFRAAHYYVSTSTSYNATVKNNIFVADGGTTPYAIYLSAAPGATFAQYNDIDYNNYYSSGNLGYAGAAQADLSAWKSVVPTDSNSVNKLPVFENLPNDLELQDYTGLSCPLLPSVTEDITGYERIKSATMGCYQIVRFDKDAMVANILGVEDGVTPNQTHYVDAVVQNAGFDTLTSIALEWFIDGTSIGTLTPGISLALEEYDTVRLGSIPLSYTIGNHTIKVVVNGVNGGLDEKPANDTLEMIYFSCTGTVSGDVRVGSSAEADYSDITTLINRIKTCGISGKVTIFLEDGTHTKSIDLSPITATSNDTIELVSLSGNVDSVIIATNAFGIKTGNLDNIYIKDITINLMGEGYGILLGGGDNIEINGCKINLDTTLAKGLSSGSTHVAIYKPEDAEVSNYVRILNNIITGGYNGIIIYAGNATTYGTNWIYDGNTVQKAYWQTIYMNYTDFLSMSNNVSKPMTTATYNTTGWWGFTVQNCNVQIIQGNRIHGQGYTFTNPIGMFFHALNTNVAPVKIYNNEVILSRSGSSTDNAFVFRASSSGNIYHNSIYVKDAAASTYAALYISTDKVTDVKNNNLIASQSPVVVIWSDVTTLDYNNYYTEGAATGAYNGTIAEGMDRWKSISNQDANSVSVRPKFLDLTQSMEVIDSFAYIGCPILPDVVTDINNTVRQYAVTAMGAYELIPADTLTVKHRLLNFPKEAVVNQQIPVEIEITNFSTIVVDSVLLAYSYNEGTPSYYLWKSTSPLATLTSIMVDIDTINMSSDVDLRIWIAAINGINMVNSLTDTISATLKLIPLVEFTDPVGNTVMNVLSFDVHANIFTTTGAPLTHPVLHVKSELNSYLYQDSFPMTLNNGEWIATIPPQYYGCKITYWLNVSDNIGNNVTVIDSVNLTAVVGVGDSEDTVIIGTGTGGVNYLPAAMFYRTNWSRQIYLYEEVCPDQTPLGTIIKKIAWYSNNINYTYTKQACYMRAIIDSIENTGYIEPISNGALQVWSGTMAIAPGWVEIELDEPFYLPSGMNLEIFWHHRDSTYPGSTYLWAYTPTSEYMAVYAQSDAGFPTTATGTQVYNRSNIKITKSLPIELYPNRNLGIISVLSPVFNPEEPCEVAYSPVQISLMNLGDQDYNFTEDSIKIRYEIIDPDHLTYTGTLSIDTGELLAGREMIIELLSNFPIIAGTSSIRAWVISPVDSISYDDTIFHTYVSQKIGLPVDEYFSSTILPSVFTATPDDANGWRPYHPAAGFPVQPDSAGTGMLRYAGAMGTMATLSTSRQLDLYGTVSPKLEFWYYHDSTLSESDNSYTDVNLTVDGVFETVLYLLKRSKIYHGWTQYIVDLASYTTAQCVLLEFESMNKSNQTVQYIDRIFITSDQDLAVLDILISPEIRVCELDNKNVSIVIATTTNHSIDFSQYPTSLALEIPGYPTIYHPLQGSIHGYISDTILVASNIELSLGTSQIKAYLAVSVDGNNLNDAIVKTIDISPKFDIEIAKLSIDELALAGFEYEQKITITNTGNMELSDIGLILSVTSDDGTYTFNARDTFNQALQPNASADFIFNQAYTVPWCENYTVEVHGYLICDSMLFNKDFSVQENVNMVDLKLVSIEKPEDDGAIDIIGSSMEVIVNIQNLSPGKSYTSGEAKAGIILTDTNGNPVASLPNEGLPFIGSAITNTASITYPFNGKYTVPNLKEYYLVVYIDGTDQYNQNDTLKLRRTTNAVGTNDLSKVSFTMEQNIPNPAKGNMIINYSIPQDGEILFNVYSASGQLLYTKQENVSLGKHQIKLNLSDYASGVYFYTMEYNGQRISKRMSIAR